MEQGRIGETNKWSVFGFSEVFDSITVHVMSSLCGRNILTYIVWLMNRKRDWLMGLLQIGKMELVR